MQGLYQPKWEKIRYGAWYLDPKTWRKQKVNEPLEDPKAAADAIQNLRKRFSEKVLQEAEVMQLHGTHAFKEFLERKGYRKPEVSHNDRLGCLWPCAFWEKSCAQCILL
uniref:Uncharacterized protein n=1 Tax=Chelonoidis abingdonii TaxID=106734 RepID=A0A8C0GSM4_CHEAB